MRLGGSKHACPPFANTIEPNHVARELVLTVLLPEDTGLCGDGQPKIRRFRSHRLELGERLATFRARYGVTQAEVAHAVGASNGSTVSLWERGVNVPDGLLRERLTDLVEGRRWPELRAVALRGGDGDLSERWDRAVRWYRRASRERWPRETVGAAVAAVLDELRSVVSSEALRRHYRARDGEWAPTIVARRGLGDEERPDPRRAEDAAYGLRWLELAHDLRLDLERSLAPQPPRALLGGTPHPR